MQLKHVTYARRVDSAHNAEKNETEPGDTPSVIRMRCEWLHLPENSELNNKMVRNCLIAKGNG